MTEPERIVYEALIANNGPHDPDGMPYPVSLKPIAQAVVVALSDAGLLTKRRRKTP